jgi:hypothetical protein
MWLTLCLKCRYEDKRWIPRNGASRLPSGARDEKISESQASATRSGHVQRSSFEQHRVSPAATSKIAPVASRMPTKVPSSIQALSIFYFDKHRFRYNPLKDDRFFNSSKVMHFKSLSYYQSINWEWGCRM